MRIAMIGQQGIPARHGGVEKAVEELAARLAERGHSVTVFNKSTAESKPATYRGIELRYVPVFGGKHLSNLTQSLAGAVVALWGRYDIVHYHALGPCLASPISRLWPKSRIVVTLQGRDDQRAKWSKPAQAVLSLAAWLSAKVPHGSIAVSRQLQQEFRDEFGRETVHIPNGVAVREAAAVDSADDPLERFGLTPGGYLVNVGRLVPEKAIDQLLATYPQVPTQTKLVIVGGSSHTDGYVDRLHELAAKDPRIVLTGPIYGDGTDRLFRNALGFVTPSLLEGLPLALLEAVSYDLPLVVSDIPPHLEVVDQNGAGHRVFRTGDLEDMAKAVTALVTDPIGERQAGQAMRERVLEEYSWESITDRTEALYRDLLAK